MRISLLLLTICVPLLALSQSPDLRMPKTYACHWTTEAVQIDGVAEESWDAAPWTDAFLDIEGEHMPKPAYETKVKMLWDDDYFYFFATLEEEHLWATLTKRDAIIYYDNDFEIFVDPDGDTHNYYEFEVNALNTVFDLLLVKPYYLGGPNLNAWDFDGLQTAVKLNGTLNDPSDVDESWTVEVAIPWHSFQAQRMKLRKPKAGDQWRLNFSRVHYDLEVVDGAYQKMKDAETGKLKPEYNWVWTAQDEINMHKPQKWGVVEFMAAEQGANNVVSLPEDEPLRQWLYVLVQRQMHYWVHHQFQFNSDLEAWFVNAPDWWTDYEVSAQVLEQSWDLSVKHKASGQVWRIQEKGLLSKPQSVPLSEK